MEYSLAEGMKKIAVWDPNQKIKMLRTNEEVLSQIAQSLHNKTLIVTTRTGMPYMRIKQVTLSLIFFIIADLFLEQNFR